MRANLACSRARDVNRVLRWRYRTERLGSQTFDDSFDDYLGFLEPRLREAHRVLASNGTKILWANVQLMPDPTILSLETGTRHRTAERMAATRPDHFALGDHALEVGDVNPLITESEGVGFRNDGNAVDLEYEMAQMARNTERYVALSNVESRRMRTLKSVIMSDV